MINKQVERDLRRDRLSGYLPYLAYDSKQKEFLNSDDSFGYIYECTPLYFMGGKTVDILESIIKQDYGKGAVLQFIMFADSNIEQHYEYIVSSDIKKHKSLKK